jgi:hypothetical protein
MIARTEVPAKMLSIPLSAIAMALDLPGTNARETSMNVIWVILAFMENVRMQ